MALSLLNSVCSLATKLTATIPSSPSSSSSPPLLSPTPAVKEDLEKLQRTLRRIQAVLADAERREILDESVKLWVKELKEVAYAAEDVLEEYQYELLRIQVESRVASAEASRKRKREQEEQQGFQMCTAEGIYPPSHFLSHGNCPNSGSPSMKKWHHICNLPLVLPIGLPAPAIRLYQKAIKTSYSVIL